MRVLLVVYCFPPLLVPASICYLKLVLGLNELGYDVHVLCIDPDSSPARGTSQIDSSLADLVPEGTTVHEVWSWETNPLARLLKRFQPIYEMSYRLWEPRKKEWVFPALRMLHSMDVSQFDAVLTCSQPHVNHLIGLHLKRKIDKPWIVYLSDPWTDAVWGELPPPHILKYHRRLEREVLCSADLILFTSPETVDLVMNKYPPTYRARCDVLPHCFVPEWYNRVRHHWSPPIDRRILILHAGHFYGPRSPAPVLSALERLADEAPDLSSRLAVHFYGMMEDRDRTRIECGVLQHVVTTHDTIPYLETLAALRGADYLLLIEAPLYSHGESVFLPSKLVDYLGSGKPVIGITPSRGAAARVLRQTGHTAIDVADADAIFDALRRIAMNEFHTRPDAAMAAQFEHRRTIRILDGHLRRLASIPLKAPGDLGRDLNH